MSKADPVDLANHAVIVPRRQRAANAAKPPMKLSAYEA
jgi:hypothetical protein